MVKGHIGRGSQPRYALWLTLALIGGLSLGVMAIIMAGGAAEAKSARGGQETI